MSLLEQKEECEGLRLGVVGHGEPTGGTVFPLFSCAETSQSRESTALDPGGTPVYSVTDSQD